MDAKDKDGITRLHHAKAEEGLTRLHHAKDKDGLYTRLHRAKDDEGLTPLQVAANSKSFETIVALLRSTCEKSTIARDFLEWIVAENKSELLQVMIIDLVTIRIVIILFSIIMK